MSARDQFDFTRAAQAASTPNLITLEEVIERTSLQRTTIYELMKRGHFPAQVKIGKASRWVDVEVASWIEHLRSSRPPSPTARS